MPRLHPEATRTVVYASIFDIAGASCSLADNSLPKVPVYLDGRELYRFVVVRQRIELWSHDYKSWALTAELTDRMKKERALVRTHF